MHMLTEEEFAFHQTPENNYLSVVDKENVEEEEEETKDSNDSESPISNINPNLKVIAKAPIGKGVGNTDIPQTTREVIAVLAQVEKGDNIAKAFDVSNATVSNYKHGKTVHGDESSNPELKTTVEKTIDKITEQAVNKLFSSINQLSEDDIACLGAKDKADIAVKMSKVVTNLKPKDSGLGVNAPQVLIYAPQILSEDKYKTVEV